MKALLSHLRYAFLNSKDSTLLIVVSNELSREYEEKMLKYKKAIAWTIADIRGVNFTFCTHNVILEDKYILNIQPQMQLNPTKKKIVKKVVLKLLDAGMIYPH